MQISIINDCFDENAKLRQISRAGALFPFAGVNCFAVNNELEASGFLIDALDAFEQREGVILANVAPRNGDARRWKNGTPFGYFWHGKTLVVSSVDGLILSLPKKIGLMKEFNLFDIEDVMNFISDDELSPEVKNKTIKTQFRSFNFLPRAADWVWRKYGLPSEKYDIAQIKDAPEAIWFIDNFGNMKTTLIGKDFNFKEGEDVKVVVKGKKYKLQFHRQLKDLPDGKFGLIEGSSGIGNRRFLEIILQGGNAASKKKLKVGDNIRI